VSLAVLAAVLAAALLPSGHSGDSRAPARTAYGSAGVAPHAKQGAAVIRPDAVQIPHFSKVAVLFLENRTYHEVIGSPNAPYLNRLARNHALATRYYGVSHPSLPNYLALTTGSTQGVTKDCNSCETSAPTLAAQLDRAGITWRAYFEGIPSPMFEGRAAGDYSKHYNPFIYSEQFGDSSTGAAHVGSFSTLGRDLRRRALPRFSWITPDLLHDGHNGSVRVSDRYAAHIVPLITRALGPRGVLFLTWDEAHGRTGPAGGHIALIAAGGGARRGARLRTHANHYSLLATLESGLRLPALGHAGSPSTPLLGHLLRGAATTPSFHAGG
jgi:acid phosphatase